MAKYVRHVRLREGKEDEPWPDEMPDRTEYTEEDEETGGGDVRPTQERVLPAHPGHCRDHDRLRALVRTHREVCSSVSTTSKCLSNELGKRTEIDSDLVSALNEPRVVVPAPQLRERRKTCGAHPVLEVLVFFKVWRGRRVRVSVREAEGPVGRGCNLGDGIVGRIRVFLGLARPRDALL